MAEWLGLASLGYEIYCHDLEVMGSNPEQIELAVHRTSVALEQKQTKSVL